MVAGMASFAGFVNPRGRPRRSNGEAQGANTGKLRDW